MLAFCSGDDVGGKKRHTLFSHNEDSIKKWSGIGKFLLEYNCSIMLYSFLPYSIVNQPYVCIYSCYSWTSLPPISIPPLEVITEHQAELLCYRAASQWLFILHMVVYICPCYFLNSSSHSFPPCVHKFILYVCTSIPARQIVSSVPFF